MVQVLVRKFLTIDSLASPAITAGEITTLTHKALDDTVKLGALVVQRLSQLSHAPFASAQSVEVLRSARYNISVQLHSHASSACACAADCDVKENSVE